MISIKLRGVVIAAAVALCPLVSMAGGGSLGTPSPSASFSNTVNGAFTDNWTFDLGSASIVAASLTNVEISFYGKSGGILGFSASLNGTPLLLNTSSVTVPPVTVNTQVLAGVASMGPGAMFKLTVSGTGITGTSASYGGNLVATPVPEPETWALMLAGVGAVGFLARRRQAI